MRLRDLVRFLPVVTPLPTFHFSNRTYQFLNESANASNVAGVPRMLLWPYEDLMGFPLTIGTILFFIVGAQFLRQEEATVIVVEAILLGGTILALVPPEFQIIANILFILVLGGTFYVFVMKKK